MERDEQGRPVLEGTGIYPFKVVVEGQDLVVYGARATWFGGSADPTDPGSTASGVMTKGNPDILGCSLPMDIRNYEPTAGSPLPRLPWHIPVIVRAYHPEKGPPTQVPVLALDLIDIGPAHPPKANAAIDLTVAAMSTLAGRGLPGELTVDYLIPRGVEYLDAPTKALLGLPPTPARTEPVKLTKEELAGYVRSWAPPDRWRLIVNWLAAADLKSKGDLTFVPVEAWHTAFPEEALPAGIKAEPIDGVACYPLRALAEGSGLRLVTDVAAKRNYVYAVKDVDDGVGAALTEYLKAKRRASDPASAGPEANAALSVAIRRSLVAAAPLWLGWQHQPQGPAKEAERERVRQHLGQIAAGVGMAPADAAQWVEMMSGGAGDIASVAPGLKGAPLPDQLLRAATDDYHAASALAKGDLEWNLSTKDGKGGPVVWQDGTAWVLEQTWRKAIGVPVPAGIAGVQLRDRTGLYYAVHELVERAHLQLTFDVAGERAHVSRPAAQTALRASPVLLTRTVGSLARGAAQGSDVIHPASIAGMTAAVRDLLRQPASVAPTPEVLVGTNGQPLPEARTFAEKLWQHHGLIDRIIAENVQRWSWWSLD